MKKGYIRPKIKVHRFSIRIMAASPNGTITVNPNGDASINTPEDDDDDLELD